MVESIEIINLINTIKFYIEFFELFIVVFFCFELYITIQDALNTFDHTLVETIAKIWHFFDVNLQIGKEDEKKFILAETQFRMIERYTYWFGTYERARELTLENTYYTSSHGLTWSKVLNDFNPNKKFRFENAYRVTYFSLREGEGVKHFHSELALYYNVDYFFLKLLEGFLYIFPEFKKSLFEIYNHNAGAVIWCSQSFNYTGQEFLELIFLFIELFKKGYAEELTPEALHIFFVLYFHLFVSVGMWLFFFFLGCIIVYGHMWPFLGNEREVEDDYLSKKWKKFDYINEDQKINNKYAFYHEWLAFNKMVFRDTMRNYLYEYKDDPFETTVNTTTRNVTKDNDLLDRLFGNMNIEKTLYNDIDPYLASKGVSYGTNLYPRTLEETNIFEDDDEEEKEIEYQENRKKSIEQFTYNLTHNTLTDLKKITTCYKLFELSYQEVAEFFKDITFDQGIINTTSIIRSPWKPIIYVGRFIDPLTLKFATEEVWEAVFEKNATKLSLKYSSLPLEERKKRRGEFFDEDFSTLDYSELKNYEHRIFVHFGIPLPIVSYLKSNLDKNAINGNFFEQYVYYVFNDKTLIYGISDKEAWESVIEDLNNEILLNLLEKMEKKGHGISSRILEETKNNKLSTRNSTFATCRTIKSFKINTPQLD